MSVEIIDEARDNKMLIAGLGFEFTGIYEKYC